MPDATRNARIPAFPSAIRFIGVRFARFSASLKVLLPCAKNWQLFRGGDRRYGDVCFCGDCVEIELAPFGYDQDACLSRGYQTWVNFTLTMDELSE
jgi:hypothetical protein